MKINVLVTGANGQLGKTIQELYAINKASIDFTFTTKNQLDISNENKLSLYLKKNRFDYCINCAAYTNVEQAERTPEMAFNINAKAVKYLAQACKKTNTILIHISTDYVFDGKKGSPYLKTDKPNPINVYGKSKLLGEQYIRETLDKYFIIRTSWLYSKIYGKNFYRTILQKAKDNQQLSISDNQTGCPTNCESLVGYIFEIITNQLSTYGLRHFCDDQQMTWYSFAKFILIENNLLASTKLVKDNKYATFALRPQYSVLKRTHFRVK